MAQFIFTYRRGAGPTGEDGPFAEWMAWFETLGSSIVDAGKPVSERTALGATGDATELSGYTVVTAADLAAAVALAQGCPALRHGGGIEVGALVDMTAGHEAEHPAGAAAEA